MPKILLVEDDKDLAKVVTEYLKSEHFTYEVAYDGLSGHEFLIQGHFDLIILDWDLPGMSGVEILKEFRSANGVTPVLMLTGKKEINEKEEGLDTGADDYLTKPFHMRELTARLRALLRRPTQSVSNTIKVGNLEMDPLKHKLYKDGKDIHLLPKDFSLLEFLMRHPDEIFSNEALIQRVWSFEAEATSDALRTSVKRLRKKLDDSDNEDESIIETVRRVGYRLRKK